MECLLNNHVLRFVLQGKHVTISTFLRSKFGLVVFSDSSDSNIFYASPFASSSDWNLFYVFPVSFNDEYCSGFKWRDPYWQTLEEEVYAFYKMPFFSSILMKDEMGGPLKEALAEVGQGGFFAELLIVRRQLVSHFNSSTTLNRNVEKALMRFTLSPIPQRWMFFCVKQISFFLWIVTSLGITMLGEYGVLY